MYESDGVRERKKVRARPSERTSERLSKSEKATLWFGLAPAQSVTNVLVLPRYCFSCLRITLEYVWLRID